MTIYEIITRLCFATFVGTVIGLERQLKGHPIGMRTNVLVCISSAMVMILSQKLMQENYALYGIINDPRLASQVITGIGFLGAGTIIHSDSNVKGLTTAASLWSVGCIGLVIGAGYYQLAVVATVMVFMVLLMMNYLSNFLQRKVQHRHITLTLVPEMEVFLGVISHLRDCGIDIDRAEANIDRAGSDRTARVQFSVKGIRQAQAVIKSLQDFEGILNIRYNS
ncbi:MAG: MgtC/SapB family protein [Oscillospiraceae bacterium]|nr:MgtC/SapB family protein [Oscillospiraceae bacterium]